MRDFLQQQSWKLLAIGLVLYSIVAGLLMEAPDDLGILRQTVRNLHYHVPMWFSMIFLMLFSFVYSIRYLNSGNKMHDYRASAMALTGLFFGLMGITTGSFWAKHTWGSFWTPDPKLNGAAIGVLIYLAYHTLRNSIDAREKRARISAVYNIFAFPVFVVLIIVLPKMADYSLHPGSGDSVGFNEYDLDNNLRIVFYPAVLGWILIGVWISNLISRLKRIESI